MGLKAAQTYTFAAEGHKPSFWQRLKALSSPADVISTSCSPMNSVRKLPPFTFSFATGHRNPNYELVYRDVVLEKGIDSEVPSM